MIVAVVPSLSSSYFHATLQGAMDSRAPVVFLAGLYLEGQLVEWAQGRAEVELQGHARLVRVLADRVEPLMSLLSQLWGCWRETAWQLPPCPPRVWRT